MKSIVATGALALASLPIAAWADWSGKGEAGVALATANTGAKTTTLSAKFDLASEVGKWKHAFGGSDIYTSAKAEASATNPDPQNETSAKRWELHEQTDYKFYDGAFVFGGVRHENDDIGSFEYQSVLSAGVGYKFFDTDRTKLSAQLGAGYKKFKKRGEPRSDGEAIATGLMELQQTLTATTKLIDKFTVESGASNTLLQNDLSVQVKINSVLAMALGYQLRYNTEPGPRAFGLGDYAHSDRLLTANLVYEFK